MGIHNGAGGTLAQLRRMSPLLDHQVGNFALELLHIGQDSNHDLISREQIPDTRWQETDSLLRERGMLVSPLPVEIDLLRLGHSSTCKWVYVNFRREANSFIQKLPEHRT